jgi:hypothetical protein
MDKKRFETKKVVVATGNQEAISLLSLWISEKIYKSRTIMIILKRKFYINLKWEDINWRRRIIIIY